MKGIYISLFALLVSSFSFGQAGNYRSLTSGPWGTPGTWERDADSNGSFEQSPSLVAPTAPATAGTITIRNTHIVNVAVNVSIDQTTVQSGGSLVVDPTAILTLNNNVTSDEITVNAGGTLTNNGTIAHGTITIRTINVSGSLHNNGTFTTQGNNKLLFQSGANYFHDFADGGTIPRATWNVNSSLNVVGYTSGNSTPPTFSPGQTYGNFIWNAPNQDTDIDLLGEPASVDGNFQIDDTGGAALIYNNAGANNNLSIGGDLISNGGAFAFVFGTGSPATLTLINSTSDIIIGSSGYIQFADDDDLTITCNGNFSIATGGTVDFSANSAVTSLDLFGNFTDAGGVYINGNASTINFVGSSLQTFTSATTPGGILNFDIGSGSIVAVTATSFFGGSGSFVLEAGGELQVNSTNSLGAIQNGNATGNNIRVPTANRTYQSGSKIVYANLSIPQFMGNGQPATTGVDTEINSSGVTLAVNATIGGNLTLTAGNLTVGARTLTLNGLFTPNSNSLVVAATSNIIINGTGAFGTLKTTGSTTINNLTFNRTSTGNVTLGSNLTVGGTFTQTNGNLILNGNTFTLNGVYVHTSGNIAVDAAATLAITGSGALGSPSLTGTDLNTLTLNRSGATLTTAAVITVTNLNLTAGSQPVEQ
jgi:hypothetical protein